MKKPQIAPKIEVFSPFEKPFSKTGGTTEIADNKVMACSACTACGCSACTACSACK